MYYVITKFKDSDGIFFVDLKVTFKRKSLFNPTKEPTMVLDFFANKVSEPISKDDADFLARMTYITYRHYNLDFVKVVSEEDILIKEKELH